MNYEEWIAAQAISGQQAEQINEIHQRNLLYTSTAPFMNSHQYLQMIGAAIPGSQGRYSQMKTQ